MEARLTEARMSNPAKIVPDTMEPIVAMLKAIRKSGAPQSVLELVHLRVSQINGCSYCVDSGVRSAREAGETGERLFAVAAWREAPYFTEPERAALALAEAATRIIDRGDPVSDEIWEDATKHFDEQELAAMILWIGLTNFFNHVNVTIRQPAGATW